jgi:hypothetical protein
VKDHHEPVVRYTTFRNEPSLAEIVKGSLGAEGANLQTTTPRVVAFVVFDPGLDDDSQLIREDG